MEMTTAFVLLSAIATLGFLSNKYINRKYGSKPNQELLNKHQELINDVMSIVAFNKDRADKIEELAHSISNLRAYLDSELQKMSQRIDGEQIKKSFDLKKTEVTHL